MARRVRPSSSPFSLVCGRGIIETNPLADAPEPGAAVKRERVLTDAELPIIWKGPATLGCPSADRSAAHVDRSSTRRDRLPALVGTSRRPDRASRGANKNGEPHTIPLSRQAVEFIDGLPGKAGSDFVFTTTGASSVSGFSKNKGLLDEAAEKLNGGRALPNWRLHDLRRPLPPGCKSLA